MQFIWLIYIIKNGQKSWAIRGINFSSNKNYKKDLKKRFQSKIWVKKVSFTDFRRAKDLKAEFNKKRANNLKEKLLIKNAKANLLFNLLIFRFKRCFKKTCKFEQTLFIFDKVKQWFLVDILTVYSKRK